MRSVGDFPGGPVVKNPPCNAGDMGSIPGRGTKIPHARERVSPHSGTTDAVHNSGVSDSRSHGLVSPWNSPGQNTGVGSLPFSRGSSQPRDPTQVSASLSAEPEEKSM